MKQLAHGGISIKRELCVGPLVSRAVCLMGQEHFEAARHSVDCFQGWKSKRTHPGMQCGPGSLTPESACGKPVANSKSGELVIVLEE